MLSMSRCKPKHSSTIELKKTKGDFHVSKGCIDIVSPSESLVLHVLGHLTLSCEDGRPKTPKNMNPIDHLLRYLADHKSPLW